MSDGISGTGAPGPSPADKKLYEQEYKHGANLFDRALGKYEESNNSFQKSEFEKVMEKARGVMNDSAKGLLREDLMKQNEKIEEDYKTFQKYPEDPNASKNLHNDLNEAKKKLN